MLSTEARPTVMRQDFNGVLKSANRVGCAGVQGNGPFVRIHLEVSDGVVLNASFETYHCPSAIAASNLLCRLLIGRPVQIMEKLTPSDLKTLLGSFPEGKHYVLDLVVDAARQALGFGGEL